MRRGPFWSAALASSVACGFDSGGLGGLGTVTDGATEGSSSATSVSTDSQGTSAGGTTTTSTDSDGGTASATTADPGSTGGTTTGAGSGPATTGGGEVFDFPLIDDTYLNQAAPSAGAGLDGSLRVGSGSSPDRATRALVWTDLTRLPKCEVAFAELFLYYDADGEPEWAVENTTVNAYQVVRPWAELFASWNDADVSMPWNVPGGDFDPTVLDSIVVAGGNFTWMKWNVTEAVTAWCNSPTMNVGIMLAQPADTVGMQGRKHFVSRNDTSNRATQPFLRVTLTP